MTFPSCGVIKGLLETQLSVFPAHQSYLHRRFQDAGDVELAFVEKLATLILKITDGRAASYAADYRWLAETVLEEECEFRRTGRYRHSSFDEVEKIVYADRAFMTRYMNGLLLSQLWWRNHTEVMRFFCDVFLPGKVQQFTHLEIGPGHGLFLYFAAAAPGCTAVTGWDVSPASIDLVRNVHRLLGLTRPVALELINMFDAPQQHFDSITFSEVLEHLEEPSLALRTIFNLVKPGGRAFINAPVNSPAPDHISLFRTPEDVVALVRDAGFEIEQTLFSPTTGATLARARKLSLTISAAVIGRKPANAHDH